MNAYNPLDELVTFIGDKTVGPETSDCENNRRRGTEACGQPDKGGTSGGGNSGGGSGGSKQDELLSITCSCGFGYFMPDGSWISGDDVRAGIAPPRPGMFLPEPQEEAL